MRWIPVLLGACLLTDLAAAPVDAASVEGPAEGSSAPDCNGVVVGSQFTGTCTEGDCTVGYVNGTEVFWTSGCFS